MDIKQHPYGVEKITSWIKDILGDQDQARTKITTNLLVMFPPSKSNITGQFMPWSNGHLGIRVRRVTTMHKWQLGVLYPRGWQVLISLGAKKANARS